MSFVHRIPSSCRATAGAGVWIAVATLLLGVGCANSKLSGEWVDPTYASGPLRNIYVISARKDMAKRRIWEDAFVDALTKTGAKATASYHDFPDALPDTLAVVAKVKATGYDAVLVTRRVGSETHTYTVPSMTHREATGYTHDWTGSYVESYREVTTPGYTETEHVVHCETTLWQAIEGGKLIWTGLSDTVNPQSPNELSAELTKLVMPRLRKAGML